ncbi:hypothetical protein XENOCAPTIV_027652 [Xenoophorus captivus]|uniref:Uncharacterized protein n=1 Tax=Xenoophorus captivus TaxID=1517983 RepID=A0ABV0RSG5_9TELE
MLLLLHKETTLCQFVTLLLNINVFTPKYNIKDIPNFSMLRPVYDVYINGKPTLPDMLWILWVLPELAPVKGSSIPKSINIKYKMLAAIWELKTIYLSYQREYFLSV